MTETIAPAEAKAAGIHNGRGWSISAPGSANLNYPASGTHTWNEFAGMAIECGGYSDISAVDPYTGRRFHLSCAFVADDQVKDWPRQDGPGLGLYDAMRRLIDAMEAARFAQSADEDGTAVADPRP